MQTTSKLGLQLPDGSDYISPTPFNDNFRKLDEVHPNDSGWINLNGQIKYRKWGPIVEVAGESGAGGPNIGDNQGSLSSNGGWLKIVGTLPTGYRPQFDLVSKITRLGGWPSPNGQVRIYPNGDIGLYERDAPANPYWGFIMVYIVN